jgi:pyruvyltransferase
MIKKIKRIFRLLYAFLIADRIIGGYTQVKAKDHKVNLFDYRPDFQKNRDKYLGTRYNLGDYLGFVITGWMLQKKGLSLESWVKKRRHLKCVGSNLYAGFQNATVWGSGIICKPQGHFLINAFLIHYPLTRLDIRAVRGPLTRNILLKLGQKCPEVYGDPAILMPLIYQPKREIKRDLLVIPQFVTEKTFREEYPGLDIISMNTNDYKSVIDEIASSKKVITSSLHAVILADAYGVPSVLYRGLGKRIDFKYLDYYYSTGRKDIKFAESFEDALKKEPLPLPDLKSLQEGLLKSFPYDLWES